MCLATSASSSRANLRLTDVMSTCTSLEIWIWQFLHLSTRPGEENPKQNTECGDGETMEESATAQPSNHLFQPTRAKLLL